MPNMTTIFFLFHIVLRRQNRQKWFNSSELVLLSRLVLLFVGAFWHFGTCNGSRCSKGDLANMHAKYSSSILCNTRARLAFFSVLSMSWLPWRPPMKDLLDVVSFCFTQKASWRNKGIVYFGIHDSLFGMRWRHRANHVPCATSIEIGELCFRPQLPVATPSAATAVDT